MLREYLLIPYNSTAMRTFAFKNFLKQRNYL